jgi:hypothetical protein
MKQIIKSIKNNRLKDNRAIGHAETPERVPAFSPGLLPEPIESPWIKVSSSADDLTGNSLVIPVNVPMAIDQGHGSSRKN